jgi:hypothetical protein
VVVLMDVEMGDRGRWLAYCDNQECSAHLVEDQRTVAGWEAARKARVDAGILLDGMSTP